MKIHFTSLGCPRNLVDTESMLGIVVEAGYNITDSLGDADYLVVNTCGFLEEARREAQETIEEFFSEKKSSAKVVVVGCMVQNHFKELREMFPEIHAMLGSGDIDSILDVIRSPEKRDIVTEARSYLQRGDVPRILATPSHYAYLKIAEGCRKRCSFCIIPEIKGPLKSMSIENVVQEFKKLLDQGVFEVILIAQDLGDYGKDIGSSLTALLSELLKDERDFWLRLMYVYPDEISDELITVMKSDERICRYLDMPIQHVNNDILKSMRRNTTKEDIIDVITKLRKEMPDIVIRTSLMVGFPGESSDQFQELICFLEEYKLDNVGTFIYSREEKSASYVLSGQISNDVKEKRYEQLMEKQRVVIMEKNRAMIGKRVDVIIDGYHPESSLILSGRTYGQCPEIDGCVIINDYSSVESFGDVYTVEITDIAEYDLVGRVV